MKAGQVLGAALVGAALTGVSAGTVTTDGQVIRKSDHAWWTVPYPAGDPATAHGSPMEEQGIPEQGQGEPGRGHVRVDVQGAGQDQGQTQEQGQG